MTIRSAEQLRKNLESIQKDNEQRVAKLEARLVEIEGHNGSTTQIKKEIEQAKITARRSEELAEKQLNIAEERELKAAQEIEATRKRMAADLESRQRFRAERAYIAAGGDPKEFENTWPTIREKLLEQSVLEKTAAQGTAETAIQSL
jgi:hypothetical protein